MEDTVNKSNGVSTQEGAKRKRQRKKFQNKKEEKPISFVTITKPKIIREEDCNVLVSFFTKQQRYAVPKSAISVPDTLNSTGLNEMVSTMLQQGSFHGEPPQFDFLMDGLLLPGKLCHRINSTESISREGVINIEYLEKMPPPTPHDALNHDDWVSSIHYGANNFLLTGCYDNTIHIWNPDVVTNGTNKEAKLSDNRSAHRLRIPDAHKAPVKVVSWLPKSNNRFVSGGLDQAVLVWEWSPSSNAIRCVYRCRGHSQAIESLAATPDGALFASGSWDGELKIWSTDEQNVTEPEEKEPQAKKRNTTVAPPKHKCPRVTLSEHSQSVSGLVWPSLCTLASCSWDNSVRLWDVDVQKKTLQYVAPSSCLALDSSPFNVNTILVTTVDNHVRLLDARDGECMTLSKTYQHHKRWASTVKWSPSNDQHFATGGFDNAVKLWDIRGPRTPLWEISSHDDNVLTLDWSRPGKLFSGSADTNVKMFTL